MFSTEIMSTFKEIKPHLKLKASYDKQNLTHMFFSYEMTTHVRSSIYNYLNAVSRNHKHFRLTRSLVFNKIFQDEKKILPGF